MIEKRMVRILLFGGLRQYGENGEMAVEIPNGAQVVDVRTILSEELDLRHPGSNGAALLSVSALATESGILDENAVLPDVNEMAVLPPVSGG